MNMMNVIDVGSRYGIHPSWQGLERTNINFHLFEPEPEESRRLKNKYAAARGNNVFIVNEVALGNSKSPLRLNILENAAMSGSYTRRRRREFFGERSSQLVVSKKITCLQTTVDSYCKERKITPHFLKIDTEGHELSVLRGAVNSLRSVLGLRVESSFNAVFDGGCTYEEIARYLKSKEFALVSIDYDGQGEIQHRFVSARGSYGVIDVVDTVWMRRDIVDPRPGGSIALESVLMGAVFAIKNGSPDLALAILEENYKAVRKFSKRYPADSLLAELRILVERHFYSLKWEPNQSQKQHAKWFQDVFGQKMQVGTTFMSSPMHNP